MASIHRLTAKGYAGKYSPDVHSTPSQLAEERQKVGRWKWKAMNSRRREYLNSEHDYQLVRGAQPFGKVQRMTGREAKLRNLDYEDKFAGSWIRARKRDCGGWCISGGVNRRLRHTWRQAARVALQAR